MDDSTAEDDLLTRDELKIRRREKYWENLFKKYENHQKHISEDEYVAVEDIVQIYGNGSKKAGMPRKRGRPPTKNHTVIEMEGKASGKRKISNMASKPNLELTTTSEIQIKEECFETPSKLDKTGVSVRRGRPPKKTHGLIKMEGKASGKHKISNTASKPNLDHTTTSEIQIKEECSETPPKLEKTGMPRRRGRPCKKDNVAIKVEDEEKVNRKRGRPRLQNNPSIVADVGGCNSSSIKVENSEAEIPRKRGRPSKKNNTLIKVDEVEASGSCEITKDIAKGKRGRPPLNKVIYEKYIVHTFLKKELEKEYSFLLENEAKLSKSFTSIPKKSKHPRRSKSCVHYSEISPQLVLNLFCSENYKVSKSNNKIKSSKILPLSPLKEKNARKKLMQGSPSQGDKTKRHQGCAEGNSANNTCDTSHFNTTHLSSDILHTKFVIEKKLKSSIGLMMIKRYYCLKSTDADKENNAALWRNAVKSELIKLLKIIPKEKLDQYLHWYVTSWFSSNYNVD